MEPGFVPFDADLRGGRKVHVRSILPSDEEEILQAFDRLSPDARYMRFMTAKSGLDVARLRALIASLPGKGATLVATIPAPDGVDIVATGSILVEADGKSCEFAIAVADAWAGAGLGGRLLRAVVDEARRRGLAEIHGYVLAANAPMLRLAERVGFSIQRVEGDFTLRLCRLRLLS